MVEAIRNEEGGDGRMINAVLVMHTFMIDEEGAFLAFDIVSSFPLVVYMLS